MAKKIFISYGGPDESFAIQLGQSLKTLGLDTFIFKSDAQAGRKLHRLMREEISERDYTILICSKTSLTRTGVLNEIEECLQKEARLGGEVVLIPITIDDYVFSDWAPQNPGHAQAVRDRVVADFKDVISGTKSYQNAVVALRDSIVGQTGLRPQTEILGGGYYVELQDPKGHKAQLLYSRKFIPISYDMTSLELTDLSGSGRIEVLRSNIGKLTEEIDEGGRKRLIFVSELPLKFGVLYELEVSMEATDCYLNDLETALFFVRTYYPFIEIEVKFPIGRLPKKAALWRTFELEKEKVSSDVIYDQGRRLFCRVDEPVISSSYFLEWEW